MRATPVACCVAILLAALIPPSTSSAPGSHLGPHCLCLAFLLDPASLLRGTKPCDSKYHLKKGPCVSPPSGRKPRPVQPPRGESPTVRLQLRRGGGGMFGDNTKSGRLGHGIGLTGRLLGGMASAGGGGHGDDEEDWEEEAWIAYAAARGLSGGGRPQQLKDVGAGGRWEALCEAARRQTGGLLRLANKSDLSELTRLHTAFREDVSPEAFAQVEGQPWLLEEVQEVLWTNSQEPPHLLVIASESGLLGYIYSTPEEWFERESLYIAELFVDSPTRRRGAGSILIASSLLLAAQHGVTGSHLCVGEQQREAATMYTQSFGFKPAPGAGGLMTDLEVLDNLGVVDEYLKDL